MGLFCKKKKLTAFSCQKQSPEVFHKKKKCFKKFAKSTGKHLWHSLFLNKISSLRPETFLRKRLWLRCFPLVFSKFEEHFFTEQFGKIRRSTFQHMKDISIVFYDKYDVNLWENFFGRSTAYSCTTNVFIKFHHLMKKINTTED